MPSSALKKCALRSEEHTSELQSHDNLVCRLLVVKKILFPSDRKSTHLTSSQTINAYTVFCSTCHTLRYLFFFSVVGLLLFFVFFFFFFLNEPAPPKLSSLPHPAALPI